MGRVSAGGTSALGDFTARCVGTGREEERQDGRIQQKARGFPVSEARSPVPVLLGFSYFGGASILDVKVEV